MDLEPVELDQEAMGQYLVRGQRGLEVTVIIMVVIINTVVVTTLVVVVSVVLIHKVAVAVAVVAVVVAVAQVSQTIIITHIWVSTVLVYLERILEMLGEREGPMQVAHLVKFRVVDHLEEPQLEHLVKVKLQHRLVYLLVHRLALSVMVTSRRDPLQQSVQLVL